MVALAVLGEDAEPLVVLVLAVEQAMELLGGPLKGMGQHGGEGVAFLRIADGRGQVFFEAQVAKALVEGGPCLGRAGHRNGRPAEGGHFIVRDLRLDLLDGDVGGRIAGGVEAVHLILHPDDGEGVGAQTVAAGLHDRQAGGGGNGRIHGVAALAQHFQTSGGSQIAAAAHHAVAGGDAVAVGGVGLVQRIETQIHFASS